MRARTAILIAGLTGLCLTASARAADYGIAPFEGVEVESRREIYETPPPVVTERFREERIERGPRYVEEERIDGRPGPGWHRPSYPVAARPWWRGEDCRLIIKRRMNPWGEVIERRVRVCD
ncbi:hypothetical protein [Microvirga lotononidis]|uniref:Uncharacterized protein n=1 Tax=Microvirga lotononidis TaxID=864069 RepID=I4YSD4_9HYPH|nr:hypothetical protein [Microvirga lotononidis]EIM26876.1 hypothetical protein MicloDRAFT_00034270 [Microvirga lotononidis]WQO31428.1 hypothetical protein U0023_34660 [Microvirga lotononidis]